MDYLELDDSAMQAFEDLGGHTDTIVSGPSTSASTPLRKLPRRRVEPRYLLRLEDPFYTPRDLTNILGLLRVPHLQKGITEDGEEDFCQLSQSDLNAFESWVVKNVPSRRFMKVRIGLAHKDEESLPLLGRDATLPHNRPRITGMEINPALEMPVYYFFYGTLADPARLERLLEIPSSQLPPLEPATLLDGRIRTWAGIYRALVDEPGARVKGFAFIITSSNQEDALRVYESDNYEVVAANLIVNRQEIIGRTFRFAGFDDELSG